jgi:hypothetical protein
MNERFAAWSSEQKLRLCEMDEVLRRGLSAVAESFGDELYSSRSHHEMNRLRDLLGIVLGESQTPVCHIN